MKDAAIIDYDKEFNYFHEFLFKIGKLNEKFIEKEIIIEEKELKIIKFPVTLKTLSNKKRLNYFLEKFILFLKRKKINIIILSDEFKKFLGNNTLLNNSFTIFDGNNVIKFNFSYIIKKCISCLNNNPEIIIFSNNLNKFQDYFELIFNDYRINSVVTDYKNSFLKFSDNIFKEYGFLINIYDVNEFLYRKDLFVINIDSDKVKSYFDLDLNTLNLAFIKKDIFIDFFKYVKVFDEKTLEFLIYIIYESVDKRYIEQFFSIYNIRIVKINKK